METRWHMNKLGLVDFWYYVNKEFNFSDGHMLLRGSNGSGKSVTMQSFIPLLLDGNKNSERLDAFGTRARKLENYLIDDTVDRENRIGYLYLEFKKGDSELYTTIGMGLHARKNKPLDVWYFVIEDNRRINIDLHLMDKNLAITKKELKNKIDTQLIEKQRDYVERVNKSLFGFSLTDEYKEAINLLLQLRQPKLSNSFKPTLLNEVLSKSLQPLSDEDLRDMTEAITNMDNIKDQLDSLIENVKSAEIINKEYYQYNLAVILDKYEKYMRENNNELKFIKNIDTNNKLIKQLLFSKEKSENLLKDLNFEEVGLKSEQESLGSHDIIYKTNKLTEKRVFTKDLKNKMVVKKNNLEDKENEYIDKKNEYLKQKNRLNDIEDEIIILLDSMSDSINDFDFQEHLFMKNEIIKNLSGSYNFAHPKKQLENNLNIAKNILTEFKILDSLNSQIQIIHDDLEKLEDEIEKKEIDVKKSSENYQNLIEEYKENVVNWNQTNSFLKFENLEINKIISYLISYENNKDYQKILELVYNKRQKEKDVYNNKKINYNFSLEQKNNELNNKIQEIENLQNLQEIEPNSSELSKTNRKYLKNQKIKFIPLYKLLNFEKTLDEIQKNKIEEILLKTNYLNALIINESDRQKVLIHNENHEDFYLFTKYDVDNLNNLEIDCNLNFILNSLGIDKENNPVLNDFTFEIGALEGTLTGVNKAQFIGAELREKQKKINLEILNNEKNELHKQYTELKNQYESCLHSLEIIEKEYIDFPKEEELKTSYIHFESLNQELEMIYKEKKSKEKNEIEINEKCKPYIISIQNDSKLLNIQSNLEVLNNYLECFNDYKNDFILLESSKSKYENISFHQKLENEAIENILENIAEKKNELEDNEDLLKKEEIEINILETQLKDLGYEKIKERLDIITSRLHVIPELKNNEHQNLGRYGTEIIQRNEDLKNDNESLINQKEKTNKYYNILKEEMNFNFFEITKIDDIETLKIEYQDKSKKVTSDSLQNIYHQNNSGLQDYHLSLNPIISEYYADDINDRLIIKGKYGGKQLYFNELLSEIKNAKLNQENLLKESDRELFQDILINTVSKKVRVHIQRSKEWVIKMNEYMDDMNTSSGLKLNLLWKSKKAIDEKELDTKELVSLLERDSALLKMEDLNKISEHFRLKIEQARHDTNKEGNIKSFHEIMKEVMDYRTWYSFTIMFQKSNEVKKELTNNAFAVFSGGEKAMSMYVPLFSAVAAKFKLGRIDAPLIIALDEAFAGVDENNIDSMFALIEKFGFDYIMNSQVLWGDYPSVKSLAIYELHRPNNAQFVTVMNYSWNGHVKEYHGGDW